MLGDTAVMVHPEMSATPPSSVRRCSCRCVAVKFPSLLTATSIANLVAACVKVTPAHDFNDYSVGQRHALP